MIKLFSLYRVKKNITTVDGASESDPTTIKAGSEGYPLEYLKDGYCLVEFDHKVYKYFVVSVKEEDLELVEEIVDKNDKN